MFIQIVFLLLVTGTCSRTAEALSCFSCTNATRLPDCTQTVSCPSGSACFSNYSTVHGTQLYTLGCTSAWTCPAIPTSSTGGATVIGRRTSGIESCSECCNTGNCNRQLCQHAAPACDDEHGYDCAAFGAAFDICGDASHAKSYCKKFCGFCNAVDGGWAAWTQWSLCDVTCGNGTRTKARACSDPPPENGGSDCPGEAKIYEPCTKDLCPIHGGWSSWSEWGSCSTSCDIGLQRRDRSCSNPYPSLYGDHCYGDSRDDRLCFPGACVNGSWSAWEPWARCSRTCGGGVTTRNRDCNNPTPSLTGTDCAGEPMQAESCNASPCHDGSWSTWGSWGICTKTCGGGVKTRSRICNNPIPSPGGKYCGGDVIQADSCNTSPCQGPVVFMAQHLSTQSPADNTPLVFTQVVTNVGNGYDSSSGTFTAPVAGTYSFNVQFCAYPGHYVVVGMYVNNVRKTKLLTYGDSDGAGTCRTLSYPALLKQSDKVQARLEPYSSSGRNFYQDTERIISFSGALLQ